MVLVLLLPSVTPLHHRSPPSPVSQVSYIQTIRRTPFPPKFGGESASYSVKNTVVWFWNITYCSEMELPESDVSQSVVQLSQFDFQVFSGNAQHESLSVASLITGPVEGRSPALRSGQELLYGARGLPTSLACPHSQSGLMSLFIIVKPLLVLLLHLLLTFFEQKHRSYR